MKKVRYHEMRPAEIRTVRDEFPVCYVPMGVLEWHGVHNPVGLDALKATAMAEYFAEHIGGLVMPTVWWGDNRSILAEIAFDESFPGSGGFDHRPEIMKEYGLPLKGFLDDAERAKRDGDWATFEAVLRNTFFELSTLGFSVIVTISGHYPLQDPASRVAKEFNELDRGRVIPIIGFDMVSDRFSGDHAARWETSLMLYLRPELVDMSALEADTDRPPAGVMGEDPRLATAEYGREGMEAMTDALRERVHGALSDS